VTRHFAAGAALAVLILAHPLVGRASDPPYQTVVRASGVSEAPPEDDPAGFSSVLVLRDPAAGLELPRLLERVPGLRVRESGPAGRSSLSLRGADSQQVAVFLDGVRLSSPGAGVDLALLDPSHLQRVEIRRGGGAARFGSDAVGGVLRLETVALRPHTRLALGYGSWDSLALAASRAAAAGPLRYLVSGSYRQTEGDFPYVDENGVDRVRRNNDGRFGEVLLKADRVLGATARWHLGVLDDFAFADRGAPGTSQRPSDTARQLELRNVTALRLVRRATLLPEGTLELLLAHRYGRFSFDEPAPPVVRSANQSFTVEGTARLALPLPGVGRLDAGVETRGHLFRDPDTDNPMRLETDLWLAGQLHAARRLLTFAPAVRLATATGFGAVVAPRFGLVLRPLRRVRVLRAIEVAANVGRSYRYPSFQEMYIRLDGFGGNAALQPEDAVDGDVGLRWARSWLSFEGAYFQRRIASLILFAPVSSFLVRADNYRGARTDGVELAARVGPLLGLTLRGSYTFTRARFGDPPMSLPGHPAHRAATRLAWEWGAPSRHLGGQLWSGVVVESGMVLGRFDSVEIGGRVLLSCGGALSYRGITLSVEGQNLLDQRDAVDTVGFPLPPARALASLAITR
jgi:outer membrane receptor protein involved in Fe transport